MSPSTSTRLPLDDPVVPLERFNFQTAKLGHCACLPEPYKHWLCDMYGTCALSSPVVLISTTEQYSAIGKTCTID